jgi:drug/metabolite transporter, DME family
MKQSASSNGDAAPAARSPADDALVGLLLLFAAAVLWSLNGALIKLINKDGEGPHGIVIAFYRSLIAGLFLVPFAGARLRTLWTPPEGATRFPRQLLACVAFFALMTVSFVVANTMTQSANAIILQYTSTFWIFGLSPWLLGERPRREDSWILAVAMVGIGVIFAGNASASLAGLLVALAAGLFYGLLTLMIRRLRGLDSAALTVANNLGAAVILLIPAIAVGGLALSLREAVLLVFMGAVQLGLPYYFYSLALARVPAHRAAIITMAEPILVPIWTYLAVGERVPLTTVIGGVFIFAALIAQTWLARRR